MSDATGIDLGDLPEIPEAQADSVVRDTFDFNVGFKFAFVGAGQAGGRIVETFARLGYGRCCAVNTTIADLSQLRLSDAQKYDFGNARGAGKDMRMAASLARDKDEDFYDLLQRNWGPEVDYAFVCFAAAGGTGAGTFPKLVEVARRYLETTQRPVRVGAIIALPKNSEGQQFAKNALQAVQQAKALNLSPIILIDNQKIQTLYGPKWDQAHAVENDSMAKLLHLFNRLAGTDSDLTSFDRADFAKLLDAGITTFASANITQFAGAADISTAIRDRLSKQTLATTDLSTARLAGLIYVLGQDTEGVVKSADLDYGCEMFTRVLAGGSTVFQGIYRGTGQATGIRALAMISGLAWPRDRLAELAAVAGYSRDDAAKFGL